ncbi:MAG: hypothetical protein KDB24_15495 [Microthrixaceae bacterium]|nr:hypothetical protein [Microthrixaceae bacterium]
MDRDEVGDWLRLVYGRCPGDAWLAASMIARTGEKAGRLRARSFRQVDDLDRLADEVATTAERHDVYVGCCPLDDRPAKGRGTAADAAYLPALWADLDVAGPGHSPPAEGLPLPPTRAAAIDVVSDLPTPSVFVDSGGGLQPWWILARPLAIVDDNRDEVAELVAGWGRALVAAGAAKGWHVDDVSDPARILRPPGTVNRKPSRAPAPVFIVPGEGCADLYDLDDLTPHLVAAPAPAERSTRPPEAPRELGNMRPGDTFQHLRWAEILEPLRWTYAGYEVIDGAEVELWRRPGAESYCSMKCWPNGGAVVWSSAVAPARTKWGKFAAWVHLAHGGDFDKAARAVRRAGDERAAARRKGAA